MKTTKKEMTEQILNLFEEQENNYEKTMIDIIFILSQLHQSQKEIKKLIEEISY